MTSPALSPSTAGQDPVGSGSRSWTVGRLLTVVTVLALVGFWIWILSGAPKRANPDRVDDRALVATTQNRCKEAIQTIDELPAAADTHTAKARATVVDEATTVLDQLIDRIEADAPSAGDDAVRFRGWIRDWRTYLGNRRDYTRRLQHNQRAAFLLNVNQAGDSVDRAITNFADINDIPGCDAPGDVG